MNYVSSRTLPESLGGPARSALLIAAAVVALCGSGCGEEPPSRPPSLSAPHAVATATRNDCGEASGVLARFNDSNRRCSIGLIANASSNRLAIADLGRKAPGLVDLDPSVPSSTHLEVGRHPVDVEASPDGTAAITLNSVSNNLSIVDLWRLRRLDSTIDLPATGRALETTPAPSGGGRIIVALDDPDQLWIRPGIQCAKPGGDGSGCSGLEANPETLSLPSPVSALDSGPRGGFLYVVYQDRNFMSVVALPTDRSLSERELSCRKGRSAPPCEVRRVGLTHECSDGVDNDGDGAADQNDPQCWKPTGAESPDGNGRTPRTACNDGVDNDGDGNVDRGDEQCQAAADSSERELLNPGTTSFSCNDGVDNDGDGETDYPDDESCYGPKGRTESPLESTGFESVTADRMGTFVYVVDQNDNQLLTVATDRMELVDAGRTVEPSAAPFSDRLGVTVGSRPKEAASFVSRNVRWTNPDNPSHGIVRYTFGAYVASDNGRTYFVRALTSECEVREPNRSELVPPRKFRPGTDAFRNSAERSCLTFPEFPLEKTTSGGDPVDACEQVEACLDCVDDQSFDVCRAKCEDLGGNRLECRAAGRELTPSMQTRVVVNPKFSIRDANGTTGRIQGRGRCTAPELFEDRMQSYATENTDVPRNFSCDSPLRPQPLTPLVSVSELSQDSFESLPRARLLRDVSVRMQPPTEPNGDVRTGIQSAVNDFRLRNESWTVTWEGVLPETDRKDGLAAKKTRQADLGDGTQKVVDFDPGGVDLCEAGVREGDRLIIKTDPKTGNKAPDVCSGLTTGDSRGPDDATPDNRDPYQTFRVAQVRPDRVALEILGAGTDGLAYAQTLPVRKCYPRGVDYEIRAENAWVIRGEQSGFVSERTSELGRCVPRRGVETRRLGGRVVSGGLHVGPYLSFFLYSGNVRPLRRPENEFEYEFSVRRFYGTSSFETDTILPSDMLLARDVNRGVKLLVSDASNDIIWGRNFARRKNPSWTIR